MDTKRYRPDGKRRVRVVLGLMRIFFPDGSTISMASSGAVTAYEISSFSRFHATDTHSPEGNGIRPFAC